MEVLELLLLRLCISGCCTYSKEEIYITHQMNHAYFFVSSIRRRRTQLFCIFIHIEYFFFVCIYFTVMWTVTS